MKTYHAVLGFLMVITGSLNTITVKFADKMTSTNSAGESEGSGSFFDHPFLQASAMFLGESSCMLAYFLHRWYRSTKKDKKQDDEGVKKSEVEKDEDPETIKVEKEATKDFKNPLLFLPPALCDMVATCVMYLGLTYTSASSFQMFRGSVIVFTGILTVLFLRKKLELYKWLGMLVLLGGLAIVGTTDMITTGDCYSVNVTITNSTTLPPTFHGHDGRQILEDDKICTDNVGEASNELLGDALILAAQVVVAFQSVYEEKVLVQYDVDPLLAVGLEGIFGFSTLSILLVPMGYWKVSDDWAHGPNGLFEDAIDGFVQLGNNGWLLLSFCGTIVSIAFFNFFGMIVTKELSATTRVVLDSIRTLVIWVFSMAIVQHGSPWEHFHVLTLIGFLVYMLGMFLYNDILIRPTIKKCIKSKKNIVHE